MFSIRSSLADAGEGFKCDRCGKVFAYKYYRDKHLKYTRCVDQGDRKFPCHLCNRSFEKRDRLRIHILHVHEKHRPHKVWMPHAVTSLQDARVLVGARSSWRGAERTAPCSENTTDTQDFIGLVKKARDLCLVVSTYRIDNVDEISYLFKNVIIICTFRKQLL